MLSFRTNVRNLDRKIHNSKPKDFSLAAGGVETTEKAMWAEQIIRNSYLNS